MLDLYDTSFAVTLNGDESRRLKHRIKSQKTHPGRYLMRVLLGDTMGVPFNHEHMPSFKSVTEQREYAEQYKTDLKTEQEYVFKVTNDEYNWISHLAGSYGYTLEQFILAKLFRRPATDENGEEVQRKPNTVSITIELTQDQLDMAHDAQIEAGCYQEDEDMVKHALLQWAGEHFIRAGKRIPMYDR